MIDSTMLTVDNLTGGKRKKTLSIGHVDDDMLSMKSGISASTAISSRSRRAHSQVSWNLVKNRLNVISNPPYSRSPWKQGGSSEISKHPLNVERLQNTYKMKPDPGGFFRPMLVQKEVKTVLERLLQDETYIPSSAGRLTKQMTDDVKARVKELGCKRRKIIVQVILGAQGGQSMEVASKCVWDADTDNFVSVCFENKSIFAVANIFAVYFE